MNGLSNSEKSLVIDTDTRLFGIFGHPVHHSLSPAMYNAAFRHLNVNAVYLAFDVINLDAAMQGVRALNIQGLSVTIPHKEVILPFLNQIDKTAAKIGAVNTVVNRNGELLGFNTDCIGARMALEEVFTGAPLAFCKGAPPCAHFSPVLIDTALEQSLNISVLSSKRAVILGAGGSAKAVAFGLKAAGMSVHIANRTVEKARALSEKIEGTFSNLDEVCDITADVLVNTTPVGMTPDVFHMPVSAKCLKNFSVVMDIVYAPLLTALLQEAKRCGCRTVNGLRMLLYQAVCQFELWTGLPAPFHVMENALSACMERK